MYWTSIFVPFSLCPCDPFIFFNIFDCNVYHLLKRLIRKVQQNPDKHKWLHRTETHVNAALPSYSLWDGPDTRCGKIRHIIFLIKFGYKDTNYLLNINGWFKICDTLSFKNGCPIWLCNLRRYKTVRPIKSKVNGFNFSCQYGWTNIQGQ